MRCELHAQSQTQQHRWPDEQEGIFTLSLLLLNVCCQQLEFASLDWMGRVARQLKIECNFPQTLSQLQLLSKLVSRTNLVDELALMCQFGPIVEFAAIWKKQHATTTDFNAFSQLHKIQRCCGLWSG